MTIELSGHYGYGRLIKATLPMALMMIIVSVYSIVDGYFISNWAGSDAFAGMNLIWPPIAVVGAIGLMVGTGGSALVSKTFGEGHPEEARRIFTMMIRLTVIAGVILGTICFILMPWLAKVLGADEAMMPHAILYGRILIIVLPAYMLQMAFQPFFMVAERPHFGTALSIFSGVTNIILDALFVAVFSWGLTGAALASCAGILLNAGIPIWFFSSKRNKTQLSFVPTRLDWKKILKSCSNGISEFVGSIALSVVSMCYNWQLMRYIGANGVSAYGIIMYLGFIFAAIFIGYNMGVSQIIAYNYGAGNKPELRSLLKKSLVIIGLVGVVITALAELSADVIADIFVGYDAELRDLTAYATRVYMLSFLICGFNMFCSAWFTSLNNGIISAIGAFVRTLVFEFACVFILPMLFGIEGIWVAVNVAELLSLFLTISLIIGFRKRYGY
ncbi:MAG: MATE family efflux transporter [Bacteroidales bacterium]|nr:MATE family efflux transporter [Bacteroidales bacterium]MCI5618337.1 MATE family efflux transporter [Rikenellaceae bacterium]